MTCRSLWQTPLATQRTRTSCGPGSSTSTSSMTRGLFTSYSTAALASMGVPSLLLLLLRRGYHDDLDQTVAGERGAHARALGPVIGIGPHPLVPHLVEPGFSRHVGQEYLRRDQARLVRSGLGEILVDYSESAARLLLDIRRAVVRRHRPDQVPVGSHAVAPLSLPAPALDRMHDNPPRRR